MKSIKLLAVYLGAVVLLSACHADKLDFNKVKLPPYKGVWVLDVGATTYTVKELIRELKVDSTKIIDNPTSKQISVVERDTTIFKEISKVLAIRDFTSPPAEVSPISQAMVATPPAGDETIGEELKFTQPQDRVSPANATDIELDSVFYKAGTLKLTINSTLPVDVEDYTLTLTDVVNAQDQPLTFTGDLSARATRELSKPIAGYKFKLKKKTTGATPGYEFKGRFTGTMKVNGSRNLNTNQKITYTLAVENAAFSKAFGYFGNRTIPNVQNKIIKVSLFKDIEDTGIQFNRPEVKLIFDNSFGVPMYVDLKQISVSKNGSRIGSLTGKITDSLQYIRHPNIKEVGQTKNSTHEIDTDNSNLKTLLNQYPDQFNISLSAELNRYKLSTGNNKNFVLDSSKLRVITDLIIPLDVKIEDFQRDFVTNIGNFNLPNADTITLIAITENKMPVDGKMDLQLLDERASVLFEQTNIQFIKAFDPSRNNTGEAPEQTTSNVKLYRGNGYDELLSATAINLKMTLTTFQADQDKYVPFYSDASIKVRLKLKAHFKL